MKRITGIGLGVVLASAFVAVVVVRLQDRFTPPAPAPERVFAVRTEAVAPGLYERTRRYVGTVEAVQRAVVASRIAAPVASIARREGERVDEGDLLVRLDSEELELDAARLAAAKRRIRADLDYWRERLQEDRALVEKGTISHRTFADTERRVATLKASLDETDRALATAATRRGYAELRAPFRGRVQRVHRERGEMTAPGTPLVELVAEAPLKAVFPVPARDLDELRAGQPLYLRRGDKVVQGQVKRIYPALQQPTRTGFVEADWPAEAGMPVRPGMAVEAEVVLETATDAVTVPQHAVMRQNGTDGVFLRADERAVWRPVATGSRAGDRIRILRGLAGGEMVIVTPYPGLRDGSPIQVDGGTATAMTRGNGAEG